MQYPWQSVLIVPAANRDAANALAPLVTGGDLLADARTYSVALSPNGSDPATHYACCTAVNAAMLATMQELHPTEALLGVRHYRWEVATSALVATSSTTAALGATWGWPQSLADGGLAVVAAPIAPPVEVP